MKEKEYLHHQQFDIPGDFLLGLISLAKALASLLKRGKKFFYTGLASYLTGSLLG